MAAARLNGKPLLTLEDGFLRSVEPGPAAPSVSLILDDLGVYFDANAPSRLERLIAKGGADRARAESVVKRLRALRLSKYNAAPSMSDPPKGHVLVLDQTNGDASVRYGMADDDAFRRMLEAARSENPGCDFLIKTHPDVVSGRKRGYFTPSDQRGDTRLIGKDANPWDLIEGAKAVYAVTSQMGAEAMLAGKPVRCFGAPFYAGWGATEDEIEIPRRTERRDALDIFAAAWLDYPVYVDPWRNRVIEVEEAMEALVTLRNARRAAGVGSVATGVRLWKRRHVAGFLDAPGAPTVFEDDPQRAAKKAAATGRRVVVWAGKETGDLREAAEAKGVPVSRLEDGFLRSVGLGAALAPPLSLALDDLGIYYDPTRPSRMEALIEEACEAGLERARALIASLRRLNVTKYNLSGGAPLPPVPDGRLSVLVPGQVQDDASILTGTRDVATNLGLLEAARAANPEAWIVYKPHPDVEAGLRTGAIGEAELTRLADHIARDTPAHLALDGVDEVWTMTSLIGFEALLRGKQVVTFGAPFYAGWGLTEDRGAPPARRAAQPSLEALVHATLIAYPLYRDPVSGLPCPPEVIVERLAGGEGARASRANRVLSRLQGAFATYAHLWR